MIEINYIKAHADLFREAITRKRVPLELDELLELDRAIRELKPKIETLRRDRNRLSAITRDKAEPELAAHLQACKGVTEQLAKAEPDLRDLEQRFARMLLMVPNLPGAEVPAGVTDDDNVELTRWGVAPDFAFQTKDHLELAQLHKLVDFDGARAAAGTRAYALIGNGALLEMALMRMVLDQLLAKGFVPVVPPVLVRPEAMQGTGYFPFGEDDAYTLEGDGLHLVGTAEVPLMAMQANRTYAVDELPLRFAGISTCFRREAGAAGRDTKGLYRVHQFQKLEQVVVCAADDETTAREHQQLLQNAEEILQALELPYRVVAVCAGELGIGHVRKHDIETWMPSRNAYCETHSCSTLNAFQARRLNLRYIDAAGQKQFAHTLNNTAVASPRILIPLLENHQRENGAVYIPKGLRPYLGGRELLEPASLRQK